MYKQLKTVDAIEFENACKRLKDWCKANPGTRWYNFILEHSIVEEQAKTPEISPLVVEFKQLSLFSGEAA